jgi:hypothetical protein
VVHLSATGLLRGHKTDTKAPAGDDLARRCTGWTVAHEFCASFLYFYSGYLFAPYVFALSDRAQTSRTGAYGSRDVGAHQCRSRRVWSREWKIASPVLGFVAGCAITTTGTLLAHAHWCNFLTSGMMPVRSSSVRAVVIGRKKAR